MGLGSWIDLGTLLVAVVGVVGALLALWQSNRHKMLDLGGLYLQRYWDIDDDLLRLTKGTPEHTRARHRYLRLCEDELDAARRGWLDAEQWGLWHEWLSDETAQALISADFDACKAPSDRFTLLRACVSGRARHSWAQCPAAGKNPSVVES